MPFGAARAGDSEVETAPSASGAVMAQSKHKYCPESDGRRTLRELLRSLSFARTAVSWQDLRTAYRRHTQRTLNAEELNRICGTRDVSKNVLIRENLRDVIHFVDNANVIMASSEERTATGNGADTPSCENAETRVTTAPHWDNSSNYVVEEITRMAPTIVLIAKDLGGKRVPLALVIEKLLALRNEMLIRAVSLNTAGELFFTCLWRRLSVEWLSDPTKDFDDPQPHVTVYDSQLPDISEVKPSSFADFVCEKFKKLLQNGQLSSIPVQQMAAVLGEYCDVNVYAEVCFGVPWETLAHFWITAGHFNSHRGALVLCAEGQGGISAQECAPDADSSKDSFETLQTSRTSSPSTRDSYVTACSLSCSSTSDLSSHGDSEAAAQVDDFHDTKGSSVANQSGDSCGDVEDNLLRSGSPTLTSSSVPEWNVDDLDDAVEVFSSSEVIVKDDDDFFAGDIDQYCASSDIRTPIVKTPFADEKKRAGCEHRELQCDWRTEKDDPSEGVGDFGLSKEKSSAEGRIVGSSPPPFWPYDDDEGLNVSPPDYSSTDEDDVTLERASDTHNEVRTAAGVTLPRPSLLEKSTALDAITEETDEETCSSLPNAGTASESTPRNDEFRKDEDIEEEAIFDLHESAIEVTEVENAVDVSAASDGARCDGRAREHRSD